MKQLTIICVTTMIGFPSVAVAGFDFMEPIHRSNQVSQKTHKAVPSLTPQVAPLSPVIKPAAPEKIIQVTPTSPEPLLPDPDFSKQKGVLQVYPKGQAEKLDQNDMTFVGQHHSYKNVDVGSWKADEGESLKHVINRWSKREGVDLSWGIPERRVVLESISYFGDFEGALMHLFDEGMRGTVEGELSYVDASEQEIFPEPISAHAVRPAPVSAYSTQLPKTEEATVVERKWKAQAQEPLHNVLTRWKNAGKYKLVWDYPYNIKVDESFFAYGTVEDAVGLLLEQYPNAGRRPVGDMYKDPSTGDSVLHIREDI